MFDQRTTPYAALLMRPALGILFLAHFSLKFSRLPRRARQNSLRLWVCPAGWPTSR